MGEKEKDPRTEWPTRRKAAVMLGISVRTIDRMVVSGELKPITLEGIKRFDPHELEASDCENPNGDFQPIIDTLNDTIKKTTEHTEAFFKMVNEPAKELLTILKTEVTDLRAENKTLRDKHLETVESYEVLLSASNERELSRRESEARIKRGDQAFDLFMGLAPQLANQLIAGHKLKSTVMQMDDDTFDALMTADVLSAEAKEQLRTLRKEVTIPEPEKKEEQKSNDGAEPKPEEPAESGA